VPVALLVVLVFWLSTIFAGFGLFAPPNATVIAGLFVFALSVSSGTFAKPNYVILCALRLRSAHFQCIDERIVGNQRPSSNISTA
jgi:hypothetical protein